MFLRLVHSGVRRIAPIWAAMNVSDHGSSRLRKTTAVGRPCAIRAAVLTTLPRPLA